MEVKQHKSPVDSKDEPNFLEKTVLLNNTEKESDRSKLIEVLSRLGTLLKLSDINIKVVKENPDDFSIVPGFTVNLGKNILSNPFLTLLILRYCLEWQIWYKAQKNAAPNEEICDLAAELVTSEFLNLIPEGNKRSIQSVFSKNILRLIKNLEGSNKTGLKALIKRRNAKNINANDVHTIKLLAKPTESLLIHGGDSRLIINKKLLLNKYGCRPFPRPEAFTFASSTASSISSVAFEKAEKKRILLIRQGLNRGTDETAKFFSKEIKLKLKRNLSLPKNCKLILAPSGTDAYLEFAGICQTIFEKEIVHILVASEETGSGVALALEGKHFSDCTANEVQVKKGKRIEGFQKVDVEKIPLRDDNGILKDIETLDKQVLNVIKKVFKENKQPVLHIMRQSKLGYSAPSSDMLENLENMYGQKVLKLIDNSQLRLSRKEIADFIKKGFLMIITGSKFFTGPPFCGALIIPQEWNDKWAGVPKNLPAGIKNYCYKKAWPKNWKMTNSLQDGTNLGINLRWYASIVEIERFFQIPTVLRRLGSEKFCDYVDQLISQTAYLEHLASQAENHKVPDKDAKRTIFPFFIKMNGEVLTETQAKRLYELLNLDLSPKLNGSAEKNFVGSQLCHVGQPVKVKYRNGKFTGVLRISLGSRVVSKSWKTGDVGIFFQKVNEQINQVNIIIRKIQIILENPDWLMNSN
jgi:hypothetical protein